MASATPRVLPNVVRTDPMSEAEWALRVKLAATYRIFEHLGWHMVVYNHITVRLPGPEPRFLINPFGLRYDEVTASNLVVVDLEGNVVGASSPINFAGFVIHSAVHAQVPQAHWVMHTHTREGIAIACKANGLSNTNFYSAMIWGHVAYHDFEGVTVRTDECERLVRSIGDKPLVILRNHGLLAHGRTAHEAFSRLWTLQLACETQLLADSMPGPNIEVSETATRNTVRDSGLFDSDDGDVGGELFAALERIVEAKDPSYKT
ncbi:MAG: class II aldolase/adducin family protein [Gammaproteobacteria bacterium]|nr:class II aldolase/adducin family protein [Gammaproteobacteria bacterium]